VKLLKLISTDGDILIDTSVFCHAVEDPDHKGTVMLHLWTGQAYEVAETLDSLHVKLLEATK
jgi:hypothetical protein